MVSVFWRQTAVCSADEVTVESGVFVERIGAGCLCTFIYAII